MKSDQKKWNLRYQEDMGSSNPSELVQQYYTLAHPGRALDLACGNGRNSLFLAQKQFRVDAVDISDVAIQQLKKKHPDINALCRDLDTWKIPGNHYDVILNIRFLDRRLINYIKKGLKPGGLLIFQSFTGQKDTAYCLAENELCRLFSGFKIVFYEEKPTDTSARFEKTASLVAQKP